MVLKDYNFNELRTQLIAETKKKISESVHDDTIISQAINTISELDRVCNILAKRLREWYGLYNPELSHDIFDHIEFTKQILELNNNNSEMGGVFNSKDLEQIKELAEKLKGLYDEKDSIVDYIRIKMGSFCPHILEVCGPLIGAKLLAHKGHLRDLAFMPSSTIQILGAEKALFRHLKFNAKSPKYGYLLQHQDVAKAKNKGKAARQLANKISLAAKLDYFKKESVDEDKE